LDKSDDDVIQAMTKIARTRDFIIKSNKLRITFITPVNYPPLTILASCLKWETSFGNYGEQKNSSTFNEEG